MSKWSHDDVLDGTLDIITGNADQEQFCSQQPATFYEAIDPAAWQVSQAYALGAAVRPVTRNNFVYECTTAGTSGASEPTWSTTPGATVTDGTAVWTCRANYALAAVTVTGGDFTTAANDTTG